jgi:hypothetical protein
MDMASGKHVGEFSFKFTSLAVRPGPAGSTIIEGNYEGPVSGMRVATILGTAAFVGRKSGTYSSCSVLYLDNGEEVSNAGTGTFESNGKHRWKTQGLVHSSDGQAVATEGESDLATRSWSGKTFEK